MLWYLLFPPLLFGWEKYQPADESLTARQGKWTDAKVGLMQMGFV